MACKHGTVDSSVGLARFMNYYGCSRNKPNSVAMKVTSVTQPSISRTAGVSCYKY